MAGTPHNAVVTPGLMTGISVADTQGTPYVDLTNLSGCPAGSNVRVVMGQLGGAGTSNWPFYIAIN